MPKVMANACDHVVTNRILIILRKPLHITQVRSILIRNGHSIEHDSLKRRLITLRQNQLIQVKSIVPINKKRVGPQFPRGQFRLLYTTTSKGEEYVQAFEKLDEMLFDPVYAPIYSEKELPRN